MGYSRGDRGSAPGDGAQVNVSTSSPVCVKITLSPIFLSFATELCKIPEQVDK